MYYRTRGIVLKSMDYRDADKLVSIFSEKEGKIRTIAKGVKKPRSSLRACLQPFCHTQLYLHRGRDLDLITQGRIINFFGNTREDMQRTLQAVYLLELLDKSLMERVPLPGLYTDVLVVLDVMDREGMQPLFMRFVELSVLVNLGYRPVLDECVGCGSRSELGTVFDLPAGGLICSRCRDRSGSGFLLSGEAIGLLRLMMSVQASTLHRVRASVPALQQMEIFLEKYLEYHLERKFKMKDTIRRLKQMVVNLDREIPDGKH
ncbi:MAG TPA: DNA repair protein RecO [Syntrophomonadaceae bacterium]|nr:DNA repair protein RecO [Syntrophomonadaceae bacterium]